MIQLTRTQDGWKAKLGPYQALETTQKKAKVKLLELIAAEPSLEEQAPFVLRCKEGILFTLYRVPMAWAFRMPDDRLICVGGTRSEAIQTMHEHYYEWSAKNHD